MEEIVESIPFNFDELYDSVSKKFVDAGYDVQEGSNAQQLVTAMAYLVSMLNANTAVNINETILTLARKRNNVLMDARLLGYEILHKSSYVYRLLIKAPAGNFIVPKYSEFTSGSKTYYYMGNTIEEHFTEETNVIIDVKEGILKTFQNEPTLNLVINNIIENGVTIPQYYIDIPFTDVEENGIEIFLTYIDENGVRHDSEEWTRSDTFLVDKDVVLKRQYVRLDNIEYLTPRLYFRLGSVGQDLRIGTEIQMNVLISSGSEGAVTTPFSSKDGFEVIAYSLFVPGIEEESIQSIKENAPLFHNSANRAITKSDYVAICNRHPAVENTQVWDGDDEFPKRPGYIWFSFTPTKSTVNRAILPENSFNQVYSLQNPYDLVKWYTEENEIVSTNPNYKGVWDVLDDYKVPTLKFQNRHPMYIDFNYSVTILRYNVKTSVADINKSVFDVINNYFLGINEENPLEIFDSEYFQSNLNKRIDLYLTDITGFEISLDTSLTLLSKHISTVSNIINDVEVITKHCYIPLAVPFERMFDNGLLVTNNLPNIYTENFYNGLTLSLDFENFVGDENYDLININILLGTDIIGVYRIFNSTKKYIQIDITDVTLLSALETQSLKMNIKYLTPNLQFIKNCIPRLNRVEFK